MTNIIDLSEQEDVVDLCDFEDEAPKEPATSSSSAAAAATRALVMVTIDPASPQISVPYHPVDIEMVERLCKVQIVTSAISAPDQRVNVVSISALDNNMIEDAVFLLKHIKTLEDV
ncbi:hypothetical protein HK097_004959, partial [Rhizophlyctis rosea]